MVQGLGQGVTTRSKNVRQTHTSGKILQVDEKKAKEEYEYRSNAKAKLEKEERDKRCRDRALKKDQKELFERRQQEMSKSTEWINLQGENYSFQLEKKHSAHVDKLTKRKRSDSEEPLEQDSQKRAQLKNAGTGPKDEDLRNVLQAQWLEGLPVKHTHLLLEMILSLVSHEVDRYYLFALKVLSIVFQGASHDIILKKLPSMMKCALSNVLEQMSLEGTKNVHIDYPTEATVNERIECWKQRIELFRGIELGMKELKVEIWRGWPEGRQWPPRASDELQKAVQNRADGREPFHAFQEDFKTSRARAACVFQMPMFQVRETYFLCQILDGVLQRQESCISNSKMEIISSERKREIWEKHAKVLQELIEGIVEDGCEDSDMKDVINHPLSKDDDGSRQIGEEAEPVFKHDEYDSVVQTCRTRIRKYKSVVQKLREEHKLVLQGLKRRNEEEKAFTKQLTMLKKEIDTEPTEDSDMGDAADQSRGVDEDASEQTVEEVGPMLELATPKPMLEECRRIIEKYRSQIKELKDYHESRVQKLQGDNEARVEELENKIKTNEKNVNKWESLFNDFATGAGEASRRQDSEYAILDVEDDTDGEEPTDEPERLDSKMEEYRVILQERRSKMEGLESQVQDLESAKQKTSAELGEANREKDKITEECARLRERNEALTKKKDELQEALNRLQKPCSMLRGRVGSPGTEMATESEPNATVENKLGMKLERPKRHSPEVGTHAERLNDLAEPLKINTALAQWELAELGTRHNQDSPPNGVSSPMQVSEDETVPVPDLRVIGNKFRTQASRCKKGQKDKKPGGEIKNLKTNITTLRWQMEVSQRKIKRLEDDLESWERLHAWCTTKGFVVPDNQWLNKKSRQVFERVRILQEDKRRVEILLEKTINKTEADWKTCYTWLERKMDDLHTQLTPSKATSEQNHSVDIGVIATDQSHDDRVPFPELNKSSERIQALSSSLQAIFRQGGLFETDMNNTLSIPIDGSTQTDQSGATANKQLDELRAEIERMKGEVARAHEIKNGYIDETVKLKNEITKKDHEYKAEVNRLNAACTKEITRVKEESDGFKENLSKCEGEVAAREEVMKKLNKKIAEMLEELEDLRSKLRVKELEDMRSKLRVKELEDMLSKLRVKEQDKDSEEALQHVIAARDKEIQSLEVRLAKHQEKFNSKNEQLTKIRAKLEEQSAEEEKKVEMMTRLDEQLTKIEKEFKNLEAQLSMKSREVEERAGLEERFEEKLKEIQEEYREKVEKLTSALTHNIKISHEIDRLTRERTKIDDEVKKLGASEAEAKGKIDGLHKELAATKEELDRLKTTINENHKRADHDIARKEKTIKELQEQVKKVKENFQTLQEELSTCKEKMKKQEQFNQNIEDKKKEVERKDRHLASLPKEFKTLQNQLPTNLLQGRITTTEKEVESLKVKLATQREEFEEQKQLSQKIGERDEKVYNLQQTMSSDLASARSALDMLKTEANGQQGHGNDLSVVSAGLLSVETTLKNDTYELTELGRKIDAMECLMRERSSTSSADSEILKLQSQFIIFERMASLEMDLKLAQASLENVRKEREELETEKKILRDRLQNTQVEKERLNISVLARQVNDSSTTLNQFIDRYKQDFDNSKALQVELDGLRCELEEIENKVDTYTKELQLARVPLPRTFDTSPMTLRRRKREWRVMYKFSFLAEWAVGRIREMGAELEKKETEAEFTRLERSMAVDENNKTNTPFVHRDLSRSTVATPVSEHDTTFFTPDKDTTERCGIKSINHSARQHTSELRGSIGKAQYGKQKNSPSTYPSLPALPATKSMATQTDTPQPASELATHCAARSRARVHKPNTVLVEGMKISADFGGPFADDEKLRLSVLLHQISAMRTCGKIRDDVKTALKYKHIYQMSKQNKIWFEQLDQLFDKKSPDRLQVPPKRSLRNVLGDMGVKGAPIFPGPLLDIYTIIFETLIRLMAGSSNKENIANEKTTQRPVLRKQEPTAEEISNMPLRRSKRVIENGENLRRILVYDTLKRRTIQKTVSNVLC